MLEIKYLSDEEYYASVLKELKEVLGKNYTGSLNKEKYPPYWVDAVAVYKDGGLLDIRLYDPYHEVAKELEVDERGNSRWLHGYCDDERRMQGGALSEEEIMKIRKL